MRTQSCWFCLAAIGFVSFVGPERPVVFAEDASPTVNLVRRVDYQDILVSIDATPERREHALAPVLRWAVASFDRMRANVRDYSCTLVKRERVNGVLSDYQYLDLKCRNEKRDGEKIERPFGVFLRFTSPGILKGREVLYVDGRNDGKMIVRKGGRRMGYLVFELDPRSEVAMRDNRYPITDIGLENLVRQLIEIGWEELANDNCTVQYYKDAVVDGRKCTGVKIAKENWTEDARFHSVRIFVDNELSVPIHFESYGWPEQKDQQPILLEQYTYRDLHLNVGLKDIDFDRNNPDYKLRKRAKNSTSGSQKKPPELP